VALSNYYELLEIAADASIDEVKRSFRAQIARYHPDKVQHLGKEFQSMAAERAAALTEAYRILSNSDLRAEYDRAVAEAAGSADSVAPPPDAPSPAASAEPERSPAASAPRGAQFSAERATRDEFVRRATLSRLRTAIDAIAGNYEDAQLRGFDLALKPKSKLFGRNDNPRLLARFVPTVDAAALADAWPQALKWGDTKREEVCVLLLGGALAPAGELGREITEQRRKSRGAKVTVIPVDVRVWDARMPLDAPAVIKALLAHLKTGS
jgi:curved DNA-binding protein CbpA